jgi:hypothetical protein
MWTMILLLWSIPLTLGTLMLVRVADGAPAINEKERRLFLGDGEEITLSFWVGLKFTLLAVVFFVVGIAEGVVLINIGSVWLVFVPLATGVGAILLLAECLRSESSANRLTQEETDQPDARKRRTAGIFTR